jgi:coproporphyrinogen III oxidase-like Fe-S oxidoreductase
VCQVHLGGGTPTILNPADLTRFINCLPALFDLLTEVYIAVENDPREFNQELAKTMARAGVNRASLGLQDVPARLSQCRRGGRAAGRAGWSRAGSRSAETTACAARRSSN